MAIPKIDLPTYTITLASTGQEIIFRPFIVREEKILLLALETNDFNTILQSIKQVISNCLLTDIDVETLPLFEIEFIFLNIRARSMGERVDLTYICENEVDGKKCKGEMEVNVDLLEVAVQMDIRNSTINISDKIGIKLNYPTIDSMSIINAVNSSEIEVAVQLIESCTEYLFDEDQVYKPHEMEPGEFQTFIEGLTQDQFTKIKDFFSHTPAIVYDTDITCRKCSKTHHIHLEGLLDFFE